MWLDERARRGEHVRLRDPGARRGRGRPRRAGETGAEPARRTVLVIEDDRRSADLLELYLDGYQVVVARDGAEGLELARALRPRAVILDILLPRLDGWDLLARLKQDPATADIPVVIVRCSTSAARGSRSARPST